MTSQRDTSVQTVHFAKTVLKTFVIYQGNIIIERRPENQLGSFLLLVFFFFSLIFMKSSIVRVIVPNRRIIQRSTQWVRSHSQKRNAQHIHYHTGKQLTLSVCPFFVFVLHTLKIKDISKSCNLSCHITEDRRDCSTTQCGMPYQLKVLIPL